MMKTYSQNYNESLVPDYELPPILTSENGKEITNVKNWESIRRQEILTLFAQQVYGQTPNDSLTITKSIEEIPFEVAGIKGIQKQINGYGNHTAHSNTNIRISENYVGNNPEFDIFNHQAGESSRGVHSSRWPIERILSRGNGLRVLYVASAEDDQMDIHMRSHKYE